MGEGLELNKMTLQSRKVFLYSQYLNHTIGFRARLCPSLLTFHRSPVMPRALSAPHKTLIAIFISA